MVMCQRIGSCLLFPILFWIHIEQVKQRPFTIGLCLFEGSPSPSQTPLQTPFLRGSPFSPLVVIFPLEVLLWQGSHNDVTQDACGTKPDWTNQPDMQ